MSQIIRKERQQELLHVTLETVFSYARMLVHVPTPEVKCLLITSCQALESFYIRSIYKKYENFDFLNGSVSMDFKPYNKFNIDQNYFLPLRITGTNEAT